MASDTRILVYEFLRHHRSRPYRAAEIAEFYQIERGAVSGELRRLEDIGAVVKDSAGSVSGYILRENPSLRRIKVIRDLERDLPNFRAKLHDGWRLGPLTQDHLRRLPRFGVTDSDFK